MLDVRRDTIIRAAPFLSETSHLTQFDDVPKLPGQEHYYFLAALSLQLKNKTIIELGTHIGNSAYVLAYGNRVNNSNNRIITYDIVDKPKQLTDRANVDYRIADLFDPNTREQNKDVLLSSDVLFIDIDPHEGIMEYDMYCWLQANNYKGLIFFDDIHLGPGHMGVQSGHSMRDFWSKVDTSHKLDLTHVGHWSGTGLVCFDATVLSSIRVQ
jgi:predicted O-methyltransferase YrrM